MDPSLWHNPRGNSNVPPFCAPRPFWCFLFCFVWNKIFCCWFRYRFLWNVSVGISGLEPSFSCSRVHFFYHLLIEFCNLCDSFIWFVCFFSNGRSPKGRRFCRSATLTRSRPITTATTATTTTTTATTATATTATTTATAMATTTKPNNKNLRAGSSFFFCVWVCVCFFFGGGRDAVSVQNLHNRIHIVE